MAHGPAHEPPTGGHRAGSMRMYYLVGASSVVLTIIAFILVWTSALLRPYLLPIVLVMAAAQVALQTVLFMHLNLGRRLYSLFFGFGMALALVVGVGLYGVVESLSPGVPGPNLTTSSSSTSSSSTSSSSGKSSTGTTQAGGATKMSTAQLVALAKPIITAKCEACHVIGGKGGAIGPNLDEVMAGKTVAKMVPGGHPTQQAWLISWVSDPQKVWSSAIMPNLGLTPTQAQAVATYLLTQVK